MNWQCCVVVLALKTAAANAGTMSPTNISRYCNPPRVGVCRLNQRSCSQPTVKKLCLKISAEIVAGAQTGNEALPRVTPMARQIIDTAANANPAPLLLEVGASYLDHDGCYYVTLVFTYEPQSK